MKSFLLLFTFTLTFNIFAQLILPSIFSDNMVLQRDMRIPVWGKAAPFAKVTVKFKGEEKTVSADDGGDWMAFLSPVSADACVTSACYSVSDPRGNPPTPFKKGGLNSQLVPMSKPIAEKMIIESAGSKIIFTNVLIGDVWLCSGQSNMKFPLSQANEAEKYIAEANDGRIRFYQDYRFGFKPYECFDCDGSWKVCTTNSVKSLTAVGYFFGLELLHKINIPIGLIQIEYSGTIIESWMTANDLQKWNVYTNLLTSLSKYKNSKRFFYLKRKEKEEWFNNLKRADPGFKHDWMSENLNDSGWEKIDLPSKWNIPYLKNHIGSVWYRKKIDIPREWNNKNLMLYLGTIRNNDLVWLNGKLIGMTIDYRESKWDRLYKISGNEFKTGENTIVICVIGNTADAGFRCPASSLKICLRAERTNSVQLAGEWLCKKGYGGKGITKIPTSFTLDRNVLTVNYNSRIHPVIPYAIRGVLWYQGESNRHDSERYKDLFTTMIRSWRKEWGEGDFPFYFVQIAPFDYGPMYNSAFLQEAQFKTLAITNTGMAVITDIGNIKNIHPKNKKEVGHRLALWALAKDYGFTNLVYSGPLYKSFKIADNEIIITFDYAKGLKSRDGKSLTYFEIAGRDKIFYPADAKIVNDKVEVKSDKVNNPLAVRFAWSNTAEPNLCNAAGLPASPFRTVN